MSPLSAEPQKRTIVVGYVRISVDEDGRGVSLDAQRARIEAYAIAADLDLVDVLVDAGKSGKDLRRPGIQAALAMLRDGRAAGLVVLKLDRLTRSVRDLSDLIEDYFGARHSLLAVSDSIDTRTAAGRLVLNVLASVGQWEREAIGERTKTAMAFMKSHGRRVGNVPIGFRVGEDGSRLVPDAHEQAGLALAKSLRAQGLSFPAISRALAEAGHVNRRNFPFDLKTLRNAIIRKDKDNAA